MRFFTRLIALVPLVLSVAPLANAQTVKVDLNNANNQLSSLKSLLDVPNITGTQFLAINVTAKGLTTTVAKLTVDIQNSPTFGGADLQDIVTSLTVTVSLIANVSTALVNAKPQFDKLKATPDVVIILTPLIKGVVIFLQDLYIKSSDGPSKVQLGQFQNVIGTQLGIVAKVYGV